MVLSGSGTIDECRSSPWHSGSPRSERWWPRGSRPTPSAGCCSAPPSIFGLTTSRQAIRLDRPWRPGAAGSCGWFADWSEYARGSARSMLFLPLVFPNGRLLSPRWRMAGLPGAAASAVLTVLVDASGGSPAPLARSTNPSVSAARWRQSWRLPPAIVDQRAWRRPWWSWLPSSLVLRIRRSRGVERQQLKLVRVRRSGLAVGGRPRRVVTHCRHRRPRRAVRRHGLRRRFHASLVILSAFRSRSGSRSCGTGCTTSTW